MRNPHGRSDLSGLDSGEARVLAVEEGGLGVELCVDKRQLTTTAASRALLTAHHVRCCCSLCSTYRSNGDNKEQRVRGQRTFLSLSRPRSRLDSLGLSGGVDLTGPNQERQPKRVSRPSSKRLLVSSRHGGPHPGHQQAAGCLQHCGH